MKTNFNLNRPIGFNRNEEKFLVPIILELEKLIKNTQTKYLYHTIKLPSNQRRSLAELIVELAEDLHNDIGLWNSVEYYNKQLFNTPLPLFVEKENEITGMFDINRIKYFIYTLFFEFNEDLIIAPTHKDLDLLAQKVSLFLTENFKNIPKLSGIKEFLSLPNDFGWDVKQKLFWLGTCSYLFRTSFHRYIIEMNKGKMEIPAIDNFLCQETTIWSGLGVIDILAKTLDLSERNTSDIRNWYERYISYYRVISKSEITVTLENLINKTKYLVHSIGIDNEIFKIGDIFLGGLVPYDEFWYWSGAQYSFGNVEHNALEELKNVFIKTSSLIVYRYDKKLLSKAKDGLKKLHEEFINYFGSDLITFKDGLSMVAALQKKERERYELLPPNELEAHKKKHGLVNPFPRMDIPKELLESENGVAVYFDFDEGIEMMFNFEALSSGLKKAGKDLTEDELEAIRNFITSDSISPNFVRSVVSQYGAKSINNSFLINQEMNILQYLLHRYKGKYFRNIYPNLSMVSD